MQRLKTLAGFSLLILILFILITSSIYRPGSSEPAKAFSTSYQKKVVVDQKEVRRYKLHRQALYEALKVYFEKAIAAGEIVGAGISIVQGDSIVIAEGFGKRKVNSMDRVDGETIFRLGSLSKGFAGILAAGLKDEGKLHWDDKVSDYLPEFQLGDSTNTDRITLAIILSHTSGAPYHSYTNLIEAGLAVSEIAKRFKDVVPISQPGALYSYQNAMFALSGEIMRKATRQEVPSLLENRLFRPLGMSHATMDFETLSHSKDMALPHVRGRHGWVSTRLKDSYSNAIVAGGINASALDMGKWMRFLLGHNPGVMGEAVIREAFHPMIEITGHNKYYQRWPGHVASYYGFGWRIHKYVEEGSAEEKTMWHHGGSVNDYRNEIAVYPDADLGICVLLNCNSELAKKVIPDLYKIVKTVDDTVAAPQIASNGPGSTPFPLSGN